MLFPVITSFLARVTVVIVCQKSGHSGDDVIMVVMNIQINFLLLFGAGVGYCIVQVLGHNIDLIIGHVHLKLLHFVYATRSNSHTRLFV